MWLKFVLLKCIGYALLRVSLTIQLLFLRVCFGDPLTRTRSRQPGQGVAKTAWSSTDGHVTSQLFRPLNQILTSNKKATINILKWLLGFKSILYLMPSTQHTQACVFIKITVQNWFFFTSCR